MKLTEAYFDTGEINLFYLEGPDSGPPLILLHGATGDYETWSLLLPELAKRWHVFALDLRGHGQSGWANSREGYHVRHNVGDVLAFLGNKVDSPVVLVGHSWGGVIALLFCGALAKEQLRGLVLEDPPLYVRRSVTEIKPYLDYFTWVHRTKQTAHTIEDMSTAILAANPGGVPLELLESWTKNLVSLDSGFLEAVLADTVVVAGVDFERLVREITCPILLLQADPAKGSALVQDDIDLILQNAVDARLFHFPGAGHVIHEEQPAEFLKMLEFYE